MNSRVQDFNRTLEQLASAPELPACCVLAGEEILLLTETVDAFRASAARLGCTERSHWVMDARSDWSPVLASARNSSLFGDLRLLEISLPGGKPGKTGADALLNLAALAAKGQLPDVRLLIQLPSLDRAAQQSKWVTTLRQQARWIDIPGIPRDALPAWIADRLRRQEQDTDPETLAWLADKVEGNMLAAHQEIQKLALIYPAGTLSPEQVQSAVLNVARYNLYDLRDAMLLGQADRALTVLEGLRAEGEALLLVLWAVGEEIRILSRVCDLGPAGLDAGLRANRFFGTRERLARQALRRIPTGVWPLALRHVHEIDRMIKGIPVAGRLDDPWDELARLVMRMATAGAPRA